MKQIQKELVIQAPPAKVWEHLTSPAKMADWFMPNDFMPTVGHQFALDCREEGNIACIVKEVTPLKKLVFTFRAKGMDVDTLVTFMLEDIGKATKLTLVHSAWDRLKPEQAIDYPKFEQGWDSQVLPRLKALVESGQSDK